MKNIFRNLSLLLLVCMLPIALFSCSKEKKEAFVLPEREIEDSLTYEHGDFSYRIYNDNTALISEYSGNDASVTIPEEIEGINAFLRNDEDDTQLQAAVQELGGPLV